MKPLFLAILLVSAAGPLAMGATLDIYWIDVEGGAATLVVTPDAETILMDAGWPGFEGRDAERIVKVLGEEVGKLELDYFIASHFHRDHTGGVAALADRVPIHNFVDHGESVEVGWNERADELWQSYVDTAGDGRIRAEPGQRLPLANTEFVFVAARSRFLEEPLTAASPNPACRGAAVKRVDRGENGKSIGFMIRVGDFEFLDLGDLTWNYEIETACPSFRCGRPIPSHAPRDAHVRRPGAYPSHSAAGGGDEQRAAQGRQPCDLQCVDGRRVPG